MKVYFKNKGKPSVACGLERKYFFHKEMKTKINETKSFLKSTQIAKLIRTVIKRWTRA